MTREIGREFGRLTIIALIRRQCGSRTREFVEVECICGTQKVIRADHWGRDQSCGCAQREAAQEQGYNNTTHGLSKRPEYRVWKSMLDRCYRQQSDRYPYYGARGIRVVKRWHIFEVFYADMGPRPSAKHTIERNDNDSNYGPTNCRWATRTEQARNKRNTLRIQNESAVEVAEKNAIARGTFRARMYRLGWSIEQAATIPVGARTRWLND